MVALPQAPQLLSSIYRDEAREVSASIGEMREPASTS
jgi:hypothetical protein